jgi:hypothetical protein
MTEFYLLKNCFIGYIMASLHKNHVIVVLLVILTVSLYFNRYSIMLTSSVVAKSYDVLTAMRNNLDAISSSSSKTTAESNALKTKEILDLHETFFKSELKVFSQNKEDGVTERILIYLKMVVNRPPGFFVEFGTGDGQEVNTRYIREKYNWTGLLLSGFNEDLSINLHREMIMHTNIISLFEKYKVPKEIDLLSVDTDYADYWIMEAILAKYKPKVIVHEVNQQTSCVTVPKPEKLIVWEGHDEYCGGSVCTYFCLGKRFGYTLVYCESRGVNCFMVRDDLLQGALTISPDYVRTVLTPTFLYRKLNFSYKKTDKPWHYVNCTI